MYEIKICDMHDLQKCLTHVMKAAIDQWCNRLRSCVHAGMADTLNTCCEIIVYLYYVVHQNIL